MANGPCEPSLGLTAASGPWRLKKNARLGFMQFEEAFLKADDGVALFVRSQQGLTPTEAALELQPYAESLEATAAALVRAAVGRAGTHGLEQRAAAEGLVGDDQDA